MRTRDAPEENGGRNGKNRNAVGNRSHQIRQYAVEND